MRPRNPRYAAGAALTFFAFAAFFGAVVHVLSEASGLRWSAETTAAFWQRHEYLVGVVAAALCALLAAARMLPRGDGRVRIPSLVRALPFAGRGLGFAATAFAAQLGFGAFTQLAEGNPLSRGDLFTGIVAGVVAAVCGTLIVTLFKQRILGVALALVWATPRAAGGRGAVHVVAAYRGLTARATRRTPFAFRNRPPPLAA